MSNYKLKKKNQIGIIGINGQAARIIKIIKKTPKIQLSKIYYHKKLKDKKIKIITNNFNDLMKLNAIIIASPTFTHINYLKKLRNYKGYILVEKPAITKKKEGNQLLKYSDNWKQRTFVNYNFNHSKIFEEIKKIINVKKFGKPVKLMISTTHGLAFRNNNNWRFDAKKSRGVGEMNTCHFVKFATELFGEIKKYDKFEYNYAKRISKNNFDTVNLSFITKKNVFVNIFNSYATPLMNYIKVFFTNCIVLYDGETLSIHYPRETYDRNKRYKFPPKKLEKKLKFSKIWNESLQNSINYFIYHMIKNKKFSKKNFESSIKAIYPVIN